MRAYATNPDLTAARARLRATDENVAIAKAAGRPSALTDGGVSQNYDNLPRFRDAGRVLDASAAVSYPIYAGGRVRYSAQAARARVIASRADLRALEGDIFEDVVTVYMDVIRDAYIVSLNENQVHVLEINFTGSKDRFQVGDLTRTDVAQSEARLANARSQLISAQGSLSISRENYRRIVGIWPVNLEQPPALPKLPESADAAVAVALDSAPRLASAAATVEAARYDVRVAQSDRLPVLSTSGSASYTNYLNSLDKRLGLASNRGLDQVQTSASIGLRLSVPIYQGGSPAARVRQNQDLASEAGEQGVGTERAVIADARSAFSRHQVAVSNIVAIETTVSANQLALTGTRSENLAGTRTLLDVLNAQQDVLNSQVALVAATHDEYVAGYALLNAMGKGDVTNLNLDGGALYDPLPNYSRAEHSISDWADSAINEPIATRTTSDTPEGVPAIRVAPVQNRPLSATESATLQRPPAN